MRRPPSPVSLLLLAALCASLCAQGAPARPAPPHVLFDFETRKVQDGFVLTSKGVLGGRPAPASAATADAAGTPPPAGTAMRVQGFEKTFVHSKPGLVPADFTKFATIGFWVHRSEEEAKARASTSIELQLLEEEGVRYWRKFTVDHTGWRRIELPLKWFSPGGGRLPRWDHIQVMGLYFRDAGELLFDAFALQGGEGPFLHPDVDLRPLAFPGRPPEATTIIAREDFWLLTDVKGRDTELRALVDELAKLRATVVADLGLAAPLERPGLIVFAADADYRSFPPRLAERLGRQAGAPTNDGYTLLGIATTSAEGALGLRRPALVHEFVHSVLERHAQLPAATDWFHEGLASHYQDQLRPQANLAELVGRDYVDATKVRPLSTFCGSTARFRGEYVMALTVVRTLLSDPHREQFPALVAAFRSAKSTDLGPQLGPVLGTDWDGLTAHWQQTCKRIAGR